MTPSTPYDCELCAYTYHPDQGDPDAGIPPKTPFEDLPEGWACPDCGAPKSMFTPRPS